MSAERVAQAEVGARLHRHEQGAARGGGRGAGGELARRGGARAGGGASRRRLQQHRRALGPVDPVRRVVQRRLALGAVELVWVGVAREEEGDGGEAAVVDG